MVPMIFSSNFQIDYNHEPQPETNEHNRRDRLPQGSTKIQSVNRVIHSMIKFKIRKLIQNKRLIPKIKRGNILDSIKSLTQ